MSNPTARQPRPIVSAARRHAARTTAARAEELAEAAAYRALILSILTPVQVARFHAWEAAGDCAATCPCGCSFPKVACGRAVL